MNNVRFELTKLDDSREVIHARFEEFPTFAVGDMIEIDDRMVWVHTKIWRMTRSSVLNDRVFELVLGVDEVEEDKDEVGEVDAGNS